MSFDVRVLSKKSDEDALKGVKEFLEHHPNSLNFFYERHGGTLLHFSCFWNKPQVVSFLLSQNADVTIPFKCGPGIFLNGLTAKQIAEKNGYDSIVTIFEKYEKEQDSRETAKKEPIERKKAESGIAEREKAEREIAERENNERKSGWKKAEKEILERENAERKIAAKKEPIEWKKAESGIDKVEREKAERELAEREKAEREKAEREKAEREKAEREKAEREKVEREKAEREKTEKEQVEGLANYKYFSIDAYSLVKKHLEVIATKKSEKLRYTLFEVLKVELDDLNLKEDLYIIDMIIPKLNFKEFNIENYSSLFKVYFPPECFSVDAHRLVKNHLEDIVTKKTENIRRTLFGVLEEEMNDLNIKEDSYLLSTIKPKLNFKEFNFDNYSELFQKYFSKQSASSIEKMSEEKKENSMSTTKISSGVGTNPLFDHIAIRVMDVSNEPSRMLNPIIGLMDIPLCSFDEVIESLEPLIPGISNFGFTCTMFASNINNDQKQNLSDDEISSIILYTCESDPKENSLYFVLNKALREQDRRALKPFFPYLHLLLHSMCKLPKCPPGTVVWRGVQKNISSDYKKGKKIIWWGLSSCTKDMNSLDNFLGKENDRTLFNIQINSGINISVFSVFPDEQEVLVFPCVTFEVQNVYSPSKGLWIVQLKEIFSPVKLIKGFVIDN